MPSNGTSSNACDASMHWTACRSKDGCPFHYSSTVMETHSAYAPHHDNNYPQFSCGADNNNQWDGGYDSDDESYRGPWYGPHDECPCPEENAIENYTWLVDNRYFLPTEPGQILEESPKQYDPASGEQRPKFPAELYAWWQQPADQQPADQQPADQQSVIQHAAGQLPAGPHIPGLFQTETPFGPTPDELLRLDTAVEDSIIECWLCSTVRYFVVAPQCLSLTLLPWLCSTMR
jgi:hypothetical protein